MLKKIKAVVALLLLVLQVDAQQLTPQTISSAGNSKTAGGIIMEDVLGGLIANTITTPGTMYTQDFLQPEAGVVSSLPLFNNVVLSTGSGIDNAGTTFINKNTGVLLEFTLGEMASKTLQQNGQMITQGILQPFALTEGSLPVAGLEFYAKRLNATTVQLDWKTIQEINNKGFHVERKKENESAFAIVDFVKSNAIDGNSSFPLQYQKIDTNNFSGNTYYRLKQEDIDGRTAISVIRIVKGDINKQLAMQVWPVPAAGPVNVLVSGLTKPDVLMLFDMSGKLVKQQAVQNNTVVQLNNLTTGTYVLRLVENKDMVQKLIVQ